MQVIRQLPFSIKFILLEYPQKLESYRVYARILYNRAKLEVSAGFTVKLDQWNFEEGMLSPSAPNASYYNNQLEEIKNKISEIYQNLVRVDKEVTLKEIRDIFRDKKKIRPSITLLAFYDANVQEKRKMITQYTPGTITNYIKTRNHLFNYMISEDMLGLKLTGLSRRFIAGFENYLLSTKMENNDRPMERSSSNSCLSKLIAVVNDAVKQQMIEKNPFDGFKRKAGKPSNRAYLTEAELKLIKDYDFSFNYALEKVRDFFIWMTFSGLRYGDSINLKTENITVEGNEYWLNIIQHKTHEKIMLPLTAGAIEIFHKYNTNVKGSFLLPRISNQKANAYLKVIGDLCGIKTTLTCHVARHTFATMALENNVDILKVSKLLGHTSLKTTTIYAHMSRKSLTDAIQQLNTPMGATPLKVTKEAS